MVEVCVSVRGNGGQIYNLGDTGGGGGGGGGAHTMQVEVLNAINLLSLVNMKLYFFMKYK